MENVYLDNFVYEGRSAPHDFVGDEQDLYDLLSAAGRTHYDGLRTALGTAHPAAFASAVRVYGTEGNRGPFTHKFLHRDGTSCRAFSVQSIPGKAWARWYAYCKDAEMQVEYNPDYTPGD